MKTWFLQNLHLKTLIDLLAHFSAECVSPFYYAIYFNLLGTGQLKKEVKQVQASTILVGHISTNFSGNGPVVVIACTMDQGERKVAHYIIFDFSIYACRTKLNA